MKKLFAAALLATTLALGGCAATHDASMSGTLASNYTQGSIGSIAIFPHANANKIGRFANTLNEMIVETFAAKNAELQILGPFATTATLLSSGAASAGSGLISTYFKDGTVDPAKLAAVREVVRTDAAFIMRFDEIVEQPAETAASRGLMRLKTRSAIIDLRSGAVVWTGDTYVSVETERGDKNADLLPVVQETIDKFIDIAPTL